MTIRTLLAWLFPKRDWQPNQALPPGVEAEPEYMQNGGYIPRDEPPTPQPTAAERLVEARRAIRAQQPGATSQPDLGRAPTQQ